MKTVYTWPCPKCGSTDTAPDPKDGYCRICGACGHRAASETFTPKVDT